MSFDSKPWVPTRHELESMIAEAVAAHALSLKWGGTGVAAAGADDAARALDVLQTWGLLDNNLLLPLDFIPDQLPLTSILGADLLTPIFDFEELGDGAGRLYAAAAASGGRKARMGARSSADGHVELVLEPGGKSGVSVWGDPVPTTLRALRAIYARPLGNQFDQQNLPTPTIDSPGAAPINAADANGSYVQLTYDYALDLPAGIWVPNSTQRRWDPSVVVVFKSALVTSRFWFGLFSADPYAVDTLGSIKGVGIRQNADTDNNHWQFVTSDGTTQTTTDTNVSPTANAIQALRIRHLGSGVWEFATYNFTTRTWENFVENSTNSPGTADNLGLALRLSKVSSTQNRAISPKLMALRHN